MHLAPGYLLWSRYVTVATRLSATCVERSAVWSCVRKLNFLQNQAADVLVKAACVVNARVARACACMRVHARACASHSCPACKHKSHFSDFFPTNV